MKSDDFENQLRKVPMRGIPAEWRGEIFGRLKEKRGNWWRDLLWPHPLAWAALVCIWVGIGFAVADGSSSQTTQTATTSPETLMMRLAQERMFIENRGAGL